MQEDHCEFQTNLDYRIRPHYPKKLTKGKEGREEKGMEGGKPGSK